MKTQAPGEPSSAPYVWASMMLAALTLSLLSMGPAAPRTEIIAVPTAEWLGARSDLIATVRSVQSTTIPAHDDPKDPYRSHPEVTWVRFEMIEVIKGPLRAGDAVSVWAEGGAWGGSPGAGEERLVFCSIAEGHDVLGRGGKFTLTESHQGRSIYSAESKIERLYTPSFDAVTTLAGLRERTRRWAERERSVPRRHRRGSWVSRWVEVPFGVPMHGENAGGSGVYLIVPWLPEGPGYGPLPNRLLEARPPAETEHLGPEILYGTLKQLPKKPADPAIGWTLVPNDLDGWGSAEHVDDRSRAINVQIRTAGHLFIAVPTEARSTFVSTGWTAVPTKKAALVRRSPAGTTSMSVLYRAFDAGASVSIPAARDAATTLLIPPRYIKTPQSR